MKEEFKDRKFTCTRCDDLHFIAKVNNYEAPTCPKCRDFEYVERRPAVLGVDYTYTDYSQNQHD